MCHRPGISIAKQKEGMIRERDRLNAEVEDLNKVLQAQRYQNDAVEKKRVEFESKCKDLYRLLDVRHLSLKSKLNFFI